MIPLYFIRMEVIPLKRSGKIDRNALTEPELAIPGKEYTPPRDEIEDEMAAVLAEILRIDKGHISIHSNSFDLGGALDVVGHTYGLSVPQSLRYKSSHRGNFRNSHNCGIIPIHPEKGFLIDTKVLEPQWR
jgi:hypothetical protein